MITYGYNKVSMVEYSVSNDSFCSGAYLNDFNHKLNYFNW